MSAAPATPAPAASPQGGVREGVWDGAWVTGALGVALRTSAAPLGVDLADLVGLAVRRNPRRAHLLVSRVLGKHVPTDPRLVHGSGLVLGELVAAALAGTPVTGPGSPADRLGPALRAALAGPDGAAALPGAARACAQDRAAAALAAAAPPVPPEPVPDPVVLGYAETATALGHAVAEALGAGTYLHSTRRPVATAHALAGFEEEHSHAPSHLLLPADAGLLATGGPLVLVDDELSTGTTALNTIAALHAAHPRTHYVVAALVDLRAPADAERLTATAARLGARIDVVALATGTLDLPPDVLERGRRVAEAAGPPAPRGGAGPADGCEQVAAGVRRVRVGWPVDLPDGGRHGVPAASRARLEALLPAMAARLAAAVGDRPGDVLVLGTEELMHAPLRLGAALADAHDARGDARAVRFSTTTRSPVVPVDDPGYAVRTRLVFPAHDDPARDDPAQGPAGGGGQRYAHNVAPAAGGQGFGTVVVVVDDAGDTPALHAPGGLLGRVAAAAGQVLLVVLPSWRPLPPPLRGPAFGSYAPQEVSWLLTDLSGVALEAPTEEREEAVQSGGAHYAESLPVEYQPDAAYAELFARALTESAPRLAHAVGVVTELVLAARGPGVVLASLARAGTPVGILLRRWAAFAHGLDLPHHAVSIVRGRGLDPVALRYLAAHHRPPDVVFVDGWTGKGAIARELARAVATANEDLALAAGRGFDPTLAVLADPGSCTPVFGTREDFLVPSACLNSTVSGLVSRTVLSAAVLAPGQFHGAKHYAGLAGSDVSARFLDAVSSRFAEVAADVARDWPVLAVADRAPTWAGWRCVEDIAAAYGIGSVNLVKPGVGETTRVLLRRVPWRVLARAGAGADLDHVRLLAGARGVPVEEVAGLPYACVGLIHPRYTRGATGEEGTAATGPRTPRGARGAGSGVPR